MASNNQNASPPLIDQNGLPSAIAENASPEVEQNKSPRAFNYDFDLGRIGKKTIYYTHFGTECVYMNMVPEDSFITPSNSDETELSSDESTASESSSVISIPISITSTKSKKKSEKEKLSDSDILSTSTKSKKSFKKEKLSDSDIPSKSSKSRKRVKEEKLSDSDTSKSKGTAKLKRKSRSSKRSSPKSKKWSGVEYSESDNSDDDKPRPRRRKHSNHSDDDCSKSSHKKECSSLKSFKQEEPKENEYKHTPGLSAAFGNFHCEVCDITVNSEVTYQTHLQGKRHQKALNSRAVTEVAIQSLKEPRLPPLLPGVPIDIPFRRKGIPLPREISLVQEVAEAYREGPVPGLSEVVEVRPAIDGVNKDILYFCNLCEAQCVPNSVMKHLTGFKHYLRCLETIDPTNYEKYRFNTKKAIEGKVRRILIDYERKHGRGEIKVEQDFEEPHFLRSEAGQSWRDREPGASVAGSIDAFPGDDVEFVSGMAYLDTSMSDFFCKICDAHMNNKAMWEAHVRGKRHLKNVKKEPGESTSKIKTFPCPGETPHLLRLLDESEGVDEYGNPSVIVGLDYIKETQNEAGDLYNCFLCGACTSSYDVIEHLVQAKHKIKYLETMNAKGCPNAIEDIKCLSDVSAYYKESMINEQCRDALEKYGEGHVQVYRSKNLYAPSSYSGRSSRY